MVNDEIREAVARESNQFHIISKATAKRHQAEIRQLQQSSSQLRQDIETLRARNADLTRAKDILQKQVTDRNVRLWRAVLQSDNAPARPRDRSTLAGGEWDLFACLTCRSYLLLETRAANEPRFQHIVGQGCGACTDLPLVRPPLRSAVEPPDVMDGEADLAVPGTREQRVKIAAELVAGLVKNPPLEIAAEAYAKKVAELTQDVAEGFAPTQSSTLDVIATGLDKVPDIVGKGVVWCATNLFGMPDFLAKVLGFVVADVVTDPLQLKQMTRVIRIVDTVACALDGDLGVCASARHLAIMEGGQAALTQHLKVALDRAIDLHGPAVLPDLTKDPGIPEQLDPRSNVPPPPEKPRLPRDPGFGNF